MSNQPRDNQGRPLRETRLHTGQITYVEARCPGHDSDPFVSSEQVRCGVCDRKLHSVMPAW